MTSQYATISSLIIISTHILTRRMTNTARSMIASAIFQLTSSRGGWRMLSPMLLIPFHISTHILTRRMTATTFLICPRVRISTHILTRRMTFLCRFRTIYNLYFNSHPHEEDDADNSVFASPFRYFNSHPHEEDDVPLSLKRMISKPFQLTSSRGGWLYQPIL